MLSLLAVISFKAKVLRCSKSLKRKRRDPSIRPRAEKERPQRRRRRRAQRPAADASARTPLPAISVHPQSRPETVPRAALALYIIGMSSIRSIHSIRRTKSLRKSLATNFFGPFPQEIGRHKTFSAHFLRKSVATNFFGSFPQEIGRHKTFSAKSLRKSGEKNYFSQKPQEIDCHKRKRRHRGRGAREWNIFRPFAGYCRDFVCLLQKRLYLCRRFMAYVR